MRPRTMLLASDDVLPCPWQFRCYLLKMLRARSRLECSCFIDVSVVNSPQFKAISHG